MGAFSSNQSATTIGAMKIDYRIEKCIRNFMIPKNKLEELWQTFQKYDLKGDGVVSVDDFFEKIIEYPRSRVTEPLLGLIDTKSDNGLKFGEYVEIICTICCFETSELLKYLFYVLDTQKSGLVEKNEVKHFIQGIWHHEITSNVKEAMDYLEKIDDGDGTYNFKEIVQMHQKYPIVFFPVFNLQFQMMKRTFGMNWWTNHKAYIIENKAKMREIELNNLKAKQRNDADALEKVNDEAVIKRMGIKYYLMPWRRAAERIRVAKIAAIESEIENIINDE
eukprot:gene7465-10176_t